MKHPMLDVARLLSVVAVLQVAASCTKNNPEFCESDEDCTTGFCDLAGDYGPRNACADAVNDVDARPDGAVLQELTVAVTGSGAGLVTSDPLGIDCGASCVASFPSGTQLTLTAAPDATSRFVQWSGACSGSIPTCEVTVNASTNVTARFDGIRVKQVVAGKDHTCALFDTGAVRCWGLGADGRLGYANSNAIGDDETPASAGDVQIGGVATQIAAGGFHTCALLETGAVRCWGFGGNGELGYGNTDDIGDDEIPATAGDVPVGGTVVQIATGNAHTCALLDDGAVRCWGSGSFGRLGYGGTEDIGDDETPAAAGDVDVGSKVLQIAAGGSHTCAWLDIGAVRCWGWANDGQLGYANKVSIGDDETPASAGNVTIGGSVLSVTAGLQHTCSRLGTGAARCWGRGPNGRLGYGNTEWIGDNETPASAGDIVVGGSVTQISASGAHTCALLDTGRIRCWGLGDFGQLGYGNTSDVGDDENPAAAGDVAVGGNAVQVASGGNHTCALLETGAVRCWGWGANGRLGYGNTNDIGDDETPSSAGDVPVL